jgi:hypothetical protein
MRLLLPALSVVIALSGGALAQSPFRVTYQVGRTTGSQVEVKGVVFNEGRGDAIDVSVTAEALDANGKVLARGITYVASRLPERGSAYYTAKVPLTDGTVSYRVTVTSFRFAPSLQGP